MSAPIAPRLATPPRVAGAPAGVSSCAGRGLGLTDRQREALRYIDAYQQASGGISPSMNEIRDRLGLAAKSGVVRLVSALEERGHIRRLRNRARAIEIADPQPVALPTLNGEPLLLIPVHGGNDG